MQVECQTCRSMYNVADELITAQGAQFTCSECASVIMIVPQKVADEIFTAQGVQFTCPICASVIMIIPQKDKPATTEADSKPPLVPMIECPHCGKLVKAGAYICPFCNQIVSDAIRSPEPTIPTEALRKQKLIGIGTLIAGIAGIFLMLGGSEFAGGILGISSFILSAIQLSKAKKNPQLYKDARVYLKVVFWGYLLVLGLFMFVKIMF